MTDLPPQLPGDLPPPTPRRSGLSAAGSASFSLYDAVGGVRGVVESLLPSLAFLITYLVAGQLRPAVWLAVGFAAVAAVARLMTRSSPAQALAGLVGVALCAWYASRTGHAKNYYVFGFWTNVAYGLVFLLSLLPLPALTVSGRRLPAGSYPAVGLIVGPSTGEGLTWRTDPVRRRRYTLATLVFVGLFALRLVVQLPLYFTDHVAALGTARLVMGVPLMAFCVWLGWLLLRPGRERGVSPTAASG